MDDSAGKRIPDKYLLSHSKKQRSFVTTSHHQQVSIKEQKRYAAFQGKNKPTMEIYRPPSSRRPSHGMDDVTGISCQRDGLHHSKSSGSIILKRDVTNGDSQGHKVHFKFSPNSTFCKPQAIHTPAGILKRSKSLGAGEMRAAVIDPLISLESLGTNNLLSRSSNTSSSNDILYELGNFSPEIDNLIKKAYDDPNSLSGRHLMELVRQLFSRLVENSRYAEPTARFCVVIVEKEKSLTFLETLLNTCQEWFAERDKLLRYSVPNGQMDSKTCSPRWLAFMNFLNEMYCRLKRHNIQLMNETKIDGVPPGMVFLNLLCECCQVSTKSKSLNSLSEAECLFFVLTAIGRDLEQEVPHRMQNLMENIRDAFLNPDLAMPVRKTLLQLIELHAAKWQLPATAVMYYYPHVGLG